LCTGATGRRAASTRSRGWNNLPRFETEGARAERLLQEAKEAALAGLAPDQRLR
jgi:hypothetical protein